VSQKNVKRVLTDFGLSDKEAEVYIFLAKHGVLKGGQIAKQTKIDRSVVYRILKRLESKGFVESTLESPTRFIAVPLEKALDIIIKTKEDEALFVRKARKDLLEDWRKINEDRFESKLEKFIVIEGNKKIYQKILQMINEAKQQFYGIFPVSGLARAEQFGVFDAATNHPLKSNIHFQFITELTGENLKAIKLLRPKLKKEISIKTRQPRSSLTPFPRIVIKDEKEILLFTRPEAEISKRKPGEVCIYTNCESLVQTFIGIFQDLWHKSADIDEGIIEIETGKLPKTISINGEKISEKSVETLETEKEPLSSEIADWDKELKPNYVHRISLLKEEDRDILDCAAVIGEGFSFDLIEKVAGFSRLRLLKKLNSIERKHQLIRSSKEGYRFSHPKIREMLYNEIAPNLRKEYHSLIAKQLEDNYKENFEDVLDNLAYHYYYSGNAEKGVPLLLKAGENAWTPNICANKLEEAIKYYSQVLVMIGNNEEWKEERTIALEKLGDIHSIIIQHDEANEFYVKGIASTSNDALKDKIRRKIRRKKIVEGDGMKLAYFVYGEGEQTLFFVGNSVLFMPQVHHFSQRYRVVVMDLAEMLVPGIMPTEHSLELYLESMKAIIEDLKADNIYLVSSALGGTLAIHYIAKYPGKITKLALVATPPKPAYSDQPERKKQLDQFWAAAFQSPSWGWKKFREIVWAVGPYSGIVRKTKRKTAIYDQIRDQTIPPEIMLIYYKILLEADVRPLLEKIKIPTLILQGEKELDIIPLADLKYLNNKISGSKLYIFKDAELITYTEVEKFNKLLEEFFILGTTEID